MATIRRLPERWELHFLEPVLSPILSCFSLLCANHANRMPTNIQIMLCLPVVACAPSHDALFEAFDTTRLCALLRLRALEESCCLEVSDSIADRARAPDALALQQICFQYLPVSLAGAVLVCSSGHFLHATPAQSLRVITFAKAQKCLAHGALLIYVDVRANWIARALLRTHTASRTRETPASVLRRLPPRPCLTSFAGVCRLVPVSDGIPQFRCEWSVEQVMEATGQTGSPARTTCVVCVRVPAGMTTRRLDGDGVNPSTLSSAPLCPSACLRSKVHCGSTKRGLGRASCSQ